MSSISQKSDFRVQLPNCVREAYLGIDAGKTAIVLDLLFTFGYQPRQWVTYQECLNVMSDYTAIHIIRDGLKHWSIKQKSLQNGQAGRPVIAYLIPSIPELKTALTVERSNVSDTLTLADFSNQKAYRKALHRELISRNYIENGYNPVQFSRKFMSQRLNVTPSTLRAYERELGTWVEQVWSNQPIVTTYHLVVVPEVREHNGKVLKVTSRGGEAAYLPAVRSLAGLYRKKGYQVDLLQRGCNRYAPYSPYSDRAKQDKHGKWAHYISS